MGVFQSYIILADIKMVCLNPWKYLSRCLYIIRHYHKLHIGPDSFHLFYAMDPILFINQKLRAPGVLPTAHIDNAEILSAVLLRVIFRLHLKPFFYPIKVLYEIGLILHISINQSIVFHLMNLFIRSRNITSMLHVMP